MRYRDIQEESKNNASREKKNAFWWVSRFEGTGAEAWKGGSEEHSGRLSRKTAKVRGWREVGRVHGCVCKAV